MELTTKKIVHITKPQYIADCLTRFYLSVNWAIIGSVCRLFSTKPLFEPKMVYGQLNYYEQKKQWTIQWKIPIYFVPTLMC